MKSKFLPVVLMSAAMTMTLSAQTGGAAAPATKTPLPSAPAPTTSAPLSNIPSKVGTISIQDAIFNTNEGRRDMEALQKKYEPKNAELKNQNDELEALKKQLSTQGDKLNEDAAANLKKQIETKQKSFERSYQDFQEEVTGQQQDVATKILSKMAPMIVKYSQENNYTLIVDTSKVWPQSPVLWWNADAVDITKAIVDIYNAQSGVAAPATSGAAKPATPKPGASTGGAAKPAAPKPN